MKAGDWIEIVEITFVNIFQPLPKYMKIEQTPTGVVNDKNFHLFEQVSPSAHFWMSIGRTHYPIKPDQLRKLTEEETTVLCVLDK